jgi:hypothetical protein
MSCPKGPLHSTIHLFIGTQWCISSLIYRDTMVYIFDEITSVLQVLYTWRSTKPAKGIVIYIFPHETCYVCLFCPSSPWRQRHALVMWRCFISAMMTKLALRPSISSPEYVAKVPFIVPQIDSEQTRLIGFEDLRQLLIPNNIYVLYKTF